LLWYSPSHPANGHRNRRKEKNKRAKSRMTDACKTSLDSVSSPCSFSLSIPFVSRTLHPFSITARYGQKENSRHLAFKRKPSSPWRKPCGPIRRKTYCQYGFIVADSSDLNGLTRSLLCLFRRPTSNLSKSVLFFLASLAASFLAHDEACHLSPT
jgi:hypothetical protein